MLVNLFSNQIVVDLSYILLLCWSIIPWNIPTFIKVIDTIVAIYFVVIFHSYLIKYSTLAICFYNCYLSLIYMKIKQLKTASKCHIHIFLLSSNYIWGAKQEMHVASNVWCTLISELRHSMAKKSYKWPNLSQ